MADQMTLGDKIRELRQAKNWSQPRLFEESGVSVTTISRLEKRRYAPQDRTVRDLARALDVPAEELLDLPRPKETTADDSRRTLAQADVDDQRPDDQSTQPKTAATEEDRKTFADDVDEGGE